MYRLRWRLDITTVRGGDGALIVYAVENHPNDSRVTLCEDNIVQTLSSRMGTGGGNVPLVLMALGGTDANASVTDGTIAPCMLARAGTGGGQ